MCNIDHRIKKTQSTHWRLCQHPFPDVLLTPPSSKLLYIHTQHHRTTALSGIIVFRATGVFSAERESMPLASCVLTTACSLLDNRQGFQRSSRLDRAAAQEYAARAHVAARSYRHRLAAHIPLEVKLRAENRKRQTRAINNRTECAVSIGRDTANAPSLSPEEQLV